MAKQTFAADISLFCTKTKLKGAVVMRTLAMSALTELIKTSPVDTGRFRGNWRVAINKIDKSVDLATYAGIPPGLGIGRGKDGSETIQKGEAIVKLAKWEDSIALTNNIVYAIPLEYGHSKQAPNPPGILRKTYESVKANLSKALTAVQAGGTTP